MGSRRYYQEGAEKTEKMKTFVWQSLSLMYFNLNLSLILSISQTVLIVPGPGSIVNKELSPWPWD